MRIKVNGKYLDRNDRVTIDETEYTDLQAIIIIIAGAIAIIKMMS